MHRRLGVRARAGMGGRPLGWSRASLWRPPLVSALYAALALGGAACEPAVDGSSSNQVIDQSSAIVGGTTDTSDNAVMALVHQQGMTAEACSGTVIATVGSSGIFLTAGHCVVATNGSDQITMPISVADPSDLYVIPGPDWSASLQQGQYYGVAAVTVEPNYNGDVNSPYDIALVRFVGATASMPVIPALSLADDTLATGSTFTLVGYGKTDASSTAGDMNTARREVSRTVASLTSNQIEYTQTDDKGACSGDSGGPALVQTSAGLRVAGVTSFGDPGCDMIGVSVRVSSASAVIQSFIAAAPTTLDCNDCTLAVVSPGNTCVAQGETCGDSRTPCGQFLGCVMPCQTNSCVSSCQSQFAAGAKSYNDMITCQCGACSVCATNPTCGGSGGVSGSTGAGGAGGTTAGGAGAGGVLAPGSCGGVSDPRPACAACIQSQCCAQGTACSNDAICSTCLEDDDSSSACHLNGPLSDLSSCIAGCAACGSGATDAGSSTSAPTADGATMPGGGNEAGGKSGCSCATGGSGGPASGMFAGLAMLVALARRVRARRR